MMNDAIRIAIMFLAFGAAAWGQTPVGPNFQVNSYTTGTQFIPSIGVEPDGDFVVVWMSQDQDGSGYGAFGQRFEASGTPRGSEFQINTYTTGFQGGPDVAVGSAGDFVVVWTSQQDGWYGIQGRRYDASGNPLGGEFQVNTYTTGGQVGAHVARAADGRFVVAWTSAGPDGDSFGISARRFDASGNPIGDEFVVNTSNFGPQFGGDVASDANGNFVVMWQSYYNGYPQFSDLYGQAFDAAGNPVGAEFSINIGVGDDSPSVSMAPSGSFVVAWTATFGYYTGYQRDVMAGGNVVNTYTRGEQIADIGAIAHDGVGDFIVTWTSHGQDGDSGGVFGRRFGAGGGAEFSVNTYTTGWQAGAVVGADAVGNFIVAWSGWNGQEAGIFAQRFSPLLPTADIAISITDSPDPVLLGTDLVYTIIVTNNGPDPAHGVQVANPTPPGLVFVSNTGACTTPFPCTLGTVLSAQTRTITATYRVPLRYTGPNPIVDTVTATTTNVEPNPANNQATAQTALAPASADLGIVKLGPAAVTAGLNVVYSITVANVGPSDAADVLVGDPTPAGLIFVSNAGSCTTPFPCALGTIPFGQSRVITAVFHVPAGYSGPNPIANQATVTSTTADPNGANNAALTSTTVSFSADLAMNKVGPATVTAGSDIVYSIIVGSSGPSDAAGVQVADPTPPGLTFVSNIGSCTTPFPCALATIPGGQNRIITATFHVPDGYSGPNPIVNQATVTSTTPDPNGANNTDDAVTTFIPANLAPAALAVDGTGNGVFQPNETVTVAPGWRNAGAAALTNVAGAASSFTGPPGPAYTIADSAAIYGTIAPGATVSCGTDCYRMTNVAATRPALHWDTTFLESVTPGTSTKTWTLHIGDSFADVPPTSGFYRFIETILHRSVTGGCNATAYCPTSSTTRDQMAVFVLVAKEGSGYVPPACTTPVFADVPASSPFCRWVEELARRGVASGCGGGNYCPAAAVTRAQIAVFVLRTLDPALNPPACGTPVFADVPASNPFCPWIEELVRRGVATGCGGTNYCPTASVTREQMSVFLTVTFGLKLYGP